MLFFRRQQVKVRPGMGAWALDYMHVPHSMHGATGDCSCWCCAWHACRCLGLMTRLGKVSTLALLMIPYVMSNCSSLLPLGLYLLVHLTFGLRNCQPGFALPMSLPNTTCANVCRSLPSGLASWHSCHWSCMTLPHRRHLQPAHHIWRSVP